MAEFLQQLDPSKLVLAETVLSFAISPFTAPPYNLAIFLFGTYAQENTEGVQSLQTFTGLVGVSMIFDIIFLAQNSQNWFIKLVTICILLIKLPTFLAFALALRQRGSQFAGLGIRGGDLSGPTVWSMPGGFTSRDGYQSVDEDAHTQTPKAPTFQPPSAPGTQPAAPGAYQSV
jgi:hypothetical protein